MSRVMQLQAKSTWRASPPVLARHDCTLCQGTGWQMVEDRGVAVARRCSCGALHRLVRLKEIVQIPPRYEHCTLDGYQPLTPSQARALSEARRFVERFPRVERGLFFTGGAGVGKTHLAVGILMELLQRFFEDTLFFHYPRLFDIEGSRPYSARERSADLTRLKSVSLLVLDEFDPGRASGGCIARTLDLLRSRRRSGKVTLFTSDRTPLFAQGREGWHRPGYPGGGCPAAGQAELPGLVMSCARMLMIAGEDFRQDRGPASPLFQSIH